MKIKKFLTITILTMCCGIVFAAKIENLIDVPVPSKLDGSAPSLEEVKNAIIAGCKYKRWTPTINEDGSISCSILVRARHYAEVNIPYSESSYSITYKDSRELKYNEKKQSIHRNYNKWVILLSEAIQREFAAAL